MCGIVGVVSKSDLPSQEITKAALHLVRTIENRGGDGVGLARHDGTKLHRIIKQMGVTVEQFIAGMLGDVEEYCRAHPSIAMALQVRYKTAGAKTLVDTPPFWIDVLDERYVLFHNGNLTNADQLRAALSKAGMEIISTNDSELILKAIVYYVLHRDMSLPVAIRETMLRLEGSYSCILQTTKQGMLLFRDPWSNRPMKVIEEEDYFYAVSEIKHESGIQDRHSSIRRGEYGRLTASGLEILGRIPVGDTGQRCTMEYIYFQRDSSALLGQSFRQLDINKVSQWRVGDGLRLHAENSSWTRPGIVIPIPNTGIFHAKGFHLGLWQQFDGLALEFPAMVKNPWVLRTFLEAEQVERIKKLLIKYAYHFDAMRPHVESLWRRICQRHEKDPRRYHRLLYFYLIDDSIVRGNTTKVLLPLIAGMLREYYPDIFPFMRIVMCSASPPNKSCCNYGIDTPDDQELAVNLYGSVEAFEAVLRTAVCDELAKRFGGVRDDYAQVLHKLVYLSLGGLLRLLGEDRRTKEAQRFCVKCFTGIPVIPINNLQPVTL